MIQLMRPGSSLLLFAMVFIPVALRSQDLINSFALSIPMLLRGMCTFVANDLDDINADSVNYPTRPLPSKTVSPLVAAVLYFACLAAALLTIKVLVPPRMAFLYYLTMTLTISYRYVVAFIPTVKAPYTAGTITVPSIIVGQCNGHGARFAVVIIAVFAFTLGRELCMDIVDRAGDTKSLMHRLRPNSVATGAFSLQAVALFLILRWFPALNCWILVDLAAITILLAFTSLYWFRLKKHTTATDLMKLQLLLGLYFLV